MDNKTSNKGAEMMTYKQAMQALKNAKVGEVFNWDAGNGWIGFGYKNTFGRIVAGIEKNGYTLF